MNIIQLKQLFVAVTERILNRIDSLNCLEGIENKISFEGWLKVEAINAIKHRVDRVQNCGSDLKLNDGSKIELKASMDLIHKNYFFHRNGDKYIDPILLIAGGDNNRLNRYALKYNLSVLNSQNLNDFLIIALVKP